jgi:hypothetical protein
MPRMRRGDALQDALQSIDRLRLLLFDADEENEVSVGQVLPSRTRPVQPKTRSLLGGLRTHSGAIVC